uniref:ORF1 n=1 Tax=Equid alphaherpesvirus 1 TaxID=10326 RepID=A0A2P0N8I9_9ALPH|nr:ORF1 [Equid alphaherpesvirus 1]
MRPEGVSRGRASSVSISTRG